MIFLAKKSPQEKGFTLIEIMVTMVIAMVVIGGLMTNFIQQNSEYKYQGKRVDAAQDLEFTIKFIAEDLRSALVSAGAPVTITDAGASPFATTSIDFYAWEKDPAFWGPLPLVTQQALQGTNNFRALRRYTYDSVKKSLLYDRNILPTVAMTEILPHVTLFKVFDDTVARPAAYAGIPSAQPNNAAVNSSGYTILIEVEVDAGYKNGSFKDVLGNDHSLALGGDGHKRIWRYAQIYPRATGN